jgi:hypothetical protein
MRDCVMLPMAGVALLPARVACAWAGDHEVSQVYRGSAFAVWVPEPRKRYLLSEVKLAVVDRIHGRRAGPWRVPVAVDGHRRTEEAVGAGH